MFCFFSCKTQAPPPLLQTISEEQILAEFMNTSPHGGKLVFLGIAGIRSQRQESIDLALAEAARRLAIFTEVTGEFSINSTLGGRLFDYRAETTAVLHYDPAYMDNIEALEFDEDSGVLVSGNAVFVRVLYPGSLALDYQPSALPDGARPLWIENPPERIGEYIVSIGYAGRRQAHRDTVIASYENAIFSMIRRLFTVARGESVDFQGDGFFDIVSTVRQSIEAKGSLTSFYVLGTWTDPIDRSVWTLAIAQAAFQ